MNVAVQIVPENAVRSSSVPPVKLISLISKSVADSERIKVTFAVSPTFNDDDADVIAIVGLTVSTDKVNLLSVLDPSVFVLPAESENFDESTLITPSVVLSAVGVNVAV